MTKILIFIDLIDQNRLKEMGNLEKYFERFRINTIGYDTKFLSPYGERKLVYADWIASGRLYQPVEEKISKLFGPFVGNTHSESSETGTQMTLSYHEAHKIIKDHVSASKNDMIITAGSGMTAMINKWQRILGLKVPEQLHQFIKLEENLRPVVFVTHMEHQTE